MAHSRPSCQDASRRRRREVCAFASRQDTARFSALDAAIGGMLAFQALLDRLPHYVEARHFPMPPLTELRSSAMARGGSYDSVPVETLKRQP